jgi:hypothetical protein
LPDQDKARFPAAAFDQATLKIACVPTETDVGPVTESVATGGNTTA